MNSAIVKNTSIIMIIGIVSKLLGMLKQMVIAACYGANIDTDIYFLSSGFTSNITYLLCSTLSITLLTVYVSKKNNGTKQEVNEFMTSVVSFFEIFTIVVAVFFIILAQPTMQILASSYNAEQIAQATVFFRIILISLIFRVFVTINSTVLNAEKRFLPAQLTSIILSGSMMLFVFIFSGKWNIYALVAGEMFAYIAQMIYLRNRTRIYYRFAKFRIKEQHDTKKLFTLLLPLLLSYGAIEINQVVDKIVTTGLGEGVLSALSYGQLIFQAVTAIFVASLTTVFYSYFTEAVENGDHIKCVDLLKDNITLITMVLLPMTIWTVFLSKDIIQLVYGYGKFDDVAVANASLVQIGYCIGLLFIGIRELLIRAHYAYKDTRRPMTTSLIAVAVNILGTIFLSKVIGVLGVTLATSISCLVSFLLLNNSIKKHGINQRDIYNGHSLIRVGIAGIVCSGIIIAMKALITNFVIRLFACVIVSGGIYLLLLYALGVREVTQLKDLVMKKLLKRA